MINCISNVFFIDLATHVGQFRLVNGSSYFEGRLEFKFTEDLSWRAIAASNLHEGHKPVIEEMCQHLGFKTFITYYKRSKFGNSDGLTYQFYHWNLEEFEPSFTEDNAEHFGLICTISKNV